MSTQTLAARFARSARRLSLATGAIAITAALLPTEAIASTPSVAITSPTDGEVLHTYADWATPTVSQDPVVVTFTAEGATITCSLDDQAPFPCTSPVSFEHVVAGEHHVTVAADTASQTTSFTVQTLALAPPPVIGGVDGPTFVPVSVKARWKVRPRHTWVRLLKVRDLPGRVRVHVRCRDASCPTPHRFSRRANGSLDLTRHFDGHALRPGTRIVIRVTEAGEHIATFRFKIRSGARPRLVVG